MCVFIIGNFRGCFIRFAWLLYLKLIWMLYNYLIISLQKYLSSLYLIHYVLNDKMLTWNYYKFQVLCSLLLLGLFGLDYKRPFYIWFSYRIWICNNRLLIQDMIKIPLVHLVSFCTFSFTEVTLVCVEHF